jgi:hypothetical protein
MKEIVQQRYRSSVGCDTFLSNYSLATGTEGSLNDGLGPSSLFGVFFF